MSRRNRFVEPETVKIDISGDDWIEIKKKLTVGETRRMQLGGISMKGKPGQKEMELNIDLEALSLAKVVTYLTDWSFENGDGKRVDLCPEAIETLDEASYLEIEAAIDKHIEAREKEKKALLPSPKSRSRTISR